MTEGTIKQSDKPLLARAASKGNLGAADGDGGPGALARSKSRGDGLRASDRSSAMVKRTSTDKGLSASSRGSTTGGPPKKGSEWSSEAWKLHMAAGVDRRKAVEDAEKFERDPANTEWFELMKNSTVESDYAGPKPKVAITKEDMAAMCAAFRKGETLHQKFVYQILLGVKRQWTWQAPKFRGQKSQTVVDLPEPPEGAKLIVVGDTHGQLQDVLWIFAEYGMPSEKTIYLFNGDVADRGTAAVEIFMLLFGFMQLCPGSVFLSRGNHENEEINERSLKFGGGFAEEVRSKYDSPVFDFFTELFELLPLAFVVARRALVVHGGLWRHRGVSLSQLRKLDARRQCPEAPQSYDEYLFFDILWSDPHPEDLDGVHESSRGDGCVLFGRDITAEFLRRNSLQLVIRSHQLPSDGHGYEVLHDGKCITVFSAPNYCGIMGNLGAMLRFDSSLAYTPLQFAAARTSSVNGGIVSI
uniref:protein-serine/threonine phosphatase n=1 Tax=Haptolina ericina TaxID=156174 RepID=A0A7S3F1B8_9EUKA